MSENIREPMQQRSIDKKNRIIEAGYELFAEKGYFNTNTVEIAKKAGVSTGIVYGYFHDKRDILVEVLDIYIDNAFHPVFSMFDKLEKPLNFERLIPHALDSAVEVHAQNSAIHEALHALSSTDEMINQKFLALEEQMTSKIVSRFKALDFQLDDLTERVHLAIEAVQMYAHERVFDKHSYINYQQMRKIVIEMLLSLFKQ